MYVDGEMAAVDLRDRLAALGPLPASLEFIMADLCKHSLPDLATEEGQAASPGPSTRRPTCWCSTISRAWPAIAPASPTRGRRCGRSCSACAGTWRCWSSITPTRAAPLRGSAQHEDVLDLVIALRRPPDYKPPQGARFELHIEKARALAGHEIEPIEAQLRINAAGRADWVWWPIELQDSHRVAARLRDGRNPNQIARELGLSKSKAYRLRERTARRSPALFRARSV